MSKRKVLQIAQGKVHTMACPICLKLQAGLTAVGPAGTVPIGRPGSPVICCYCGALNTFDDDLDLRLMTEADIRSLGLETRQLLAEMRGFYVGRVAEPAEMVKIQGHWLSRITE